MLPASLDLPIKKNAMVPKLSMHKQWNSTAVICTGVYHPAEKNADFKSNSLYSNQTANCHITQLTLKEITSQNDNHLVILSSKSVCF